MKFDSLSFAIGKHGDSGPIRDVVSYLIGRKVGSADEIWQTLTNVDVATFTAVSSVLRELVVDITPVQSGSGDPSPSNIRHISGWMGANVHDAKASIDPIDGAEATVSSYYMRINHRQLFKLYTGTNTYDTIVPSTRVADFFTGYENLVGGTFKLSGRLTSNRTITTVYATFYSPDNTSTQVIALNGAGVAIPSGWRFNSIYCDVTNWVNGDWVQIDDLVLAVEPTTIPIPWQTEAGTVYGGTLTDNGDGTWTLKSKPYYASYNGETLIGPWVSSMNVYAEGVTPTTGAQVVDLGGAKTEYTLTAESVESLLGDNNIFADTGNINTITFRTH